jgi:hypothetical protein
MWPSEWKSLHIHVSSLPGGRYVSFSINNFGNKGVNVFLDELNQQVLRADINSVNLRAVSVDWRVLLLPYGRLWAELKLRLRIDGPDIFAEFPDTTF